MLCKCATNDDNSVANHSTLTIHLCNVLQRVSYGRRAESRRRRRRRRACAQARGRARLIWFDRPGSLLCHLLSGRSGGGGSAGRARPFLSRAAVFRSRRPTTTIITTTITDVRVSAAHHSFTRAPTTNDRRRVPHGNNTRPSYAAQWSAPGPFSSASVPRRTGSGGFAGSRKPLLRSSSIRDRVRGRTVRSNQPNQTDP